MEQKMSKEIDGGFIGFPFPPHEEQLEIGSFTYDAKRMGGAPTISASVKYPTCLDDLWTGDEYVDFRGEKYILKQTPSSSYSNEDSRYNHEMTFVSERIILDNTYFYDVVTDPTDVDKYVSNSSKVIFFGDIHEFAKRLDYSLKYSKVGYTVVVDEGISTGGFTMSFEDQFFSQVLQSIFDIYSIPYYFVGKVIHIGYTNNAITRTFKYGVDDALLSINKTNANYKIVNRITGVGSPDNIPYYYPNPSEDRAAIEAAGGKWITPSDKLMPPVYRSSLGAERFYNAENYTYIEPITGEYYIFENEYVDGNPKEHKVSFDHIKPTIKEMVNATGLRIDMFEAFDYDLNDNDETDAEGKYIHPYFFGKLRKFDGVNGFNLFDHAIEEDEMIISMTSGSCGACNFVIGVDDDTQKNPVQVHTNGELLRDKDGNVIRSGRPQPAQQDTQKNSVWIALRKDTDTFGVIMPNVTNKYKPNALTDTFVILHIDLPKAYITSAENKLKEEIIKYMATNNSDKFNFSINFSRIFFAENIDILSQLNENARLQIEYNKKLYELYISSYSYKMSSNEPLPQITVELSDTLTINKGTLQTSIDSVKQDIMSSVGGNVDFLKQGLKYFVRKDVRDYAKFIDFREGIDVGGFESLISGGTFRKDIDGKSYIEVDRLYVRLKAIFDNLEIKRTTYVGGEQIASPASMKCIKVEDKEIIVDPETEEETIIVWDYYRCYYLNEQEGVKIQNEFVIGDQAICKEANIASGSNVSNQYYWRLVVGIGDGYIDLSKADCDTGSTVPASGDDMVQLGNRDDATRQKAIIQSTVSLDAPSIKLLAGINSFSLEGKAIISMGFDSLTGKATFNVYGNAYIGNPDGSSFIRYTPEGGVEINAKLSIGTTIGDGNETVIDKINQAKQLADAAQSSTNQAIKDIAGYSYIKTALGQPPTEIQNGLILTSLISLGYNSARSEFSTQSGISGIYDATKPGGGIAYWSGGVMRDLAEDFPLPWDEANPPKPSDPSKYATTVIRMDGTAYYAMGNFWITNDGSVKCNPLSFFVGKDQVGEILSLFTPIRTGNPQRVVGFRQNYPFEDGTGKGKIRLGRFNLVEDDKGNLRLERIDGVPANFYTTGGMSALGLSPDIGGGSGGSEYLSELKDVSLTEALVANDILMFNGTKWVNIPSSSFSGSSDWNDLINKPSWIGSSKPTYTKSEIGLGNVDNTSDSSKNVLSATKLQTTRTIWGQSFNGTNDIPTSAAGKMSYLEFKNYNGDGSAGYVGRGDGSENTIYLSAYADNPIKIGNESGAAITIAPNRNVYIGTTTGGRTLNVGGWIGTQGISGWYNEDYGGGIHMTDSIWVRVYNDRRFYVSSTNASAIHTSGGVHARGRGLFEGTLEVKDRTIINGRLAVNTTQGPAISLAIGDSDTGFNWLSDGIIQLIGNGVTIATFGNKHFNLDGSFSVAGAAQFNGVPKTSQWWYSTGKTGWHNETYGGGIYQTDSDQVRVYNNKVLYNDGYRVWGIGGHHCGLKLYQASHIGINLANDKFMWGIYSNRNGNMYFGRRDGNVNDANGKYILELQGSGMLLTGSFTATSNITANGNILAKGAVTALTSASDIRLKEQLTTYNALPVINSLRSVAYKWNDTAKAKSDIFNNDEWQFGLIAQELQAMFPLFVKDVFGDYLTIDYERLIPICWRGIQELSEISNKHESRLDKLERENRELKKEVKQLKEKSYGKD